MKEYLEKELLVRLEDYHQNNPHQEATHLILHPIALSFLEIVPGNLEIITSVDLEPNEIVIY